MTASGGQREFVGTWLVTALYSCRSGWLSGMPQRALQPACHATPSKPIHRRIPHQLHIAIEQRHPFLDPAAGEGQVEKPGRVDAGWAGGGAQGLGGLGAAGDPPAQGQCTRSQEPW